MIQRSDSFVPFQTFHGKKFDNLLAILIALTPLVQISAVIPLVQRRSNGHGGVETKKKIEREMESGGGKRESKRHHTRGEVPGKKNPVPSSPKSTKRKTLLGSFDLPCKRTRHGKGRRQHPFLYPAHNSLSSEAT